jgi:hypothetical protein
MVMRCRSCGEVNIRLLETYSAVSLDMRGVARLDVARAR